MEQKPRFDSVKARTLECLRQVVIVDEARRNEIEAWLDQAIESGDLELYFAEREGRSFDDLSSIAKQIKAGIDPETIKENATKGLFGLSTQIKGEGFISIGVGSLEQVQNEDLENEQTISTPKKDTMTQRVEIKKESRDWKTLIYMDYESEFGDTASFRLDYSRWDKNKIKKKEIGKKLQENEIEVSFPKKRKINKVNEKILEQQNQGSELERQ